jgi:hypothetical protein
MSYVVTLHGVFCFFSYNIYYGISLTHICKNLIQRNILPQIFVWKPADVMYLHVHTGIVFKFGKLVTFRQT